MGLSKSSQVRAAVRHGDGTVWSANLTPAGTTVDGWHPVTTTYDGTPVTATGSPAVIYDPQTERNAVLIRSAVGGGTLYRVAETTPESGDFSGTLYGVPLDTGGIASDMTVWDYRTDEPPLYRRWSVYYLDNSYARKLATSYAS